MFSAIDRATRTFSKPMGKDIWKGSNPICCASVLTCHVSHRDSGGKHRDKIKKHRDQ